MSDTSYTVDAQLRLHGGGNFNAGMQSAAAKAMELDRSLATVRGGLMQTGRGLADMAESAAVMGAKAAAGVGAAIIASAALGAAAAFSDLSELEGKGIQLGSVLAAATSTPFETMRMESSKLFDQFRQDAITSAGETTDFVNVASKIAGPLVGAGKSMAQLHDLTLGVMNAAPAMGIAFDQAGSDVMRMLQGVAGVEQPLFRAMVAIPSLGIASAEKFNKLPIAERYQKIAQALSNPAFAAAASAYGSSWAGLTSTLSDVRKQATAALVAPIFENAKSRLSAFNDSAMASLGPGGKLTNALSLAGTAVAFRFDAMERQAARIFPSLDEGATGLVTALGNVADAGLGKVQAGLTWVADHWEPIVDGAHRFAAAIGNAADRAERLITSLGGGDFATGLGRLGEMFAAKKAAEFASPALGGLAQVGSGSVGALRALFAEGNAGAAAAAGAAKTVGDVSQFGGGISSWGKEAMAFTTPIAAGSAEAGAGLGAAGAAAGTVGAAGGAGLLTTALAALAGAIAMVIVPVTIAAGALYLMRDSFTTVGAAATAAWDRIGTAFGGIWNALGELGGALGNMLSPVGALGGALDSVLSAALGGAASAAVSAAGAVQAFIMAMTSAVNGVSSLMVRLGIKGLNAGSPLDGAVNAATLTAADQTIVAPNLAGMSTGTTGITAAMKPGGAAPKGGGGGGKQEIVIKWDLGDGNEEAIYVKTRSDFERALRSATSVSRSSPLRGTT